MSAVVTGACVCLPYTEERTTHRCPGPTVRCALARMACRQGRHINSGTRGPIQQPTFLPLGASHTTKHIAVEDCYPSLLHLRDWVSEACPPSPGWHSRHTARQLNRNDGSCCHGPRCSGGAGPPAIHLHGSSGPLWPPAPLRHTKGTRSVVVPC